MRFIFVRHGKTHFNEINLTQGWCDSPLSKVGIRQVESISKQLEQYQIDKAYTSPLGRAVQTSNIILSKKEVEPIYEERFKEVNFGILEGISTELVRKLNIESPNWLEDLDMDYRPYEGEDIHDVISKHLWRSFAAAGRRLPAETPPYSRKPRGRHSGPECPAGTSPAPGPRPPRRDKSAAR